MKTAEQIVKELIDSKRINGEDAVTLIKAIVNNNSTLTYTPGGANSVSVTVPDNLRPPFNPDSSGITWYNQDYTIQTKVTQ